MKVSFATVLATCLLAAFAASGQEVLEKQMVIAVDDGSGPVTVTLGGENAFDPAELQVGESRSIVDDDGRTVLVTRTADGIELSVDGRTIALPHIEGVHAGAHDANVDVKVMRLHGPGSPGEDAVTIISGKPLDPSVQETIRSALVSAGDNRQVVFVDGAGSEGDHMIMHGGDAHRIKVIRKEVGATN
ncbi:MAG: hypothetical protein OEW35_13510 [Gammaproteobacteria bacterium]|nr:hypothetical protein [Gammaproteobacteria bacterium]MDH4253953.1 hypothetical protein [Gammaproteobacteria bacterium]